jgi:hypothetical protein
MTRRLRISPELFLHLRGECVRIIANEMPDDARIVGRGMDGSEFYLDVESEEFDTPGDLAAPVLQECRQCEGLPA